MNNNLKGILSVAIGSASYGILATFVQLANNNGYGTAGLAFSQYLFGASVLTILSFLLRNKSRKKGITKPTSKYPRLKLMFFGSALGLTSSFYYLSIQYIPVSVGIILLMQTIWMGVVLEFFIARKLVNKVKVIGAMVAIVGTIFAAKIFESDIDIDYRGVGYGLLAALSYTAGMYASNRVSLELPNIVRSKYLIYGAFVVVILFWNVDILEAFHWELFLKWGAFLGFFGTILPPILFNTGFPIIGTALGGIVAALEIPVSVFSAFLLLGEKVSRLQWIGIFIILLAVTLINWQELRVNKIKNTE